MHRVLKNITFISANNPIFCNHLFKCNISKTSLFETVYDAYKKMRLFKAVIWTTVSQNGIILDLQTIIARKSTYIWGALLRNLNAKSTFVVDMRKIKLAQARRHCDPLTTNKKYIRLLGFDTENCGEDWGFKDDGYLIVLKSFPGREAWI